MKRRTSRIFNFILFQLGWWGSLYTAVQRLHLVLLYSFVIALLSCHFYFIVNKGLRVRELLFFIIAIPIGYFGDSVWYYLDVLRFSWGFSYFAPLWLVGMWVTFPMAIGHSFSWLEGRYILTFLLGGIGAPLCYQFGSNFDLISFNSLKEMAVYGVYWGILMVFLVWLKQRRFFREN